MNAAQPAGGLARPAQHKALPVSGAWTASQPPAQRRFFPLPSVPFALEEGGVLDEVVVAYETWGTLNADRSNAILVCHALTGDAHAAGPSGPGQPTAGWWDPLIGPGRTLDTDQYFVVCANVLGGCQGSTGPASIDPGTGRPYGSRFPVVTIRDMVRAQRRLADWLGIGRWLTVVGGSMGGMQVLEWGVIYPDRMRSLICIASAAAAGAQQIAWSKVGRMAIANDPNWRNGDYYGAEPGQGPHAGLALARQIAQIHYRSEEVFEQRFSRNSTNPVDHFGMWDRFEVESYLDYHGEKLVKRFDANSYLVLNRAMDLHDLARGRGGLADAFARIAVPTCTMSIPTDTLYPPYQQERIRDGLRAQGVCVDHVVIDSPHGHDGFLLEFDQVGAAIDKFLARL
ncbi:MAG: homoserine O-acetyltransferase [Acidimicrobiia bacterium]